MVSLVMYCNFDYGDLELRTPEEFDQIVTEVLELQEKDRERMKKQQAQNTQNRKGRK